MNRSSVMSAESTKRVDVDQSRRRDTKLVETQHDSVRTRRTESSTSEDIIPRTSTRTPSFLRLIRELRTRFPVGRQIRAEFVSYDEDDGICHETGERLSHLHIGEVRSGIPCKQKGVSFTPQTLAISALTENSVPELEALLADKSLEVNSTDEQGETLLHKAALEGDVDCIRVLVKHGANVNIKNKDGWPPLHYALCHGNLSAMVYLVECGTNMEDYTMLRVNEFFQVEKLSKTVYKGEEIFV